MKRTAFRSLSVFGGRWLPLLVVLLDPNPLPAVCTDESLAGGGGQVFVKHLTGCSEWEREARAVMARELLAAIQSGKGIDLAGVVVSGDLRLDELTPLPVEAIPGLSPDERNAVLALNVEKVRLISGPLTIRDSVVKGSISTGIKEGYIVVRGPVILTGTVFQAMLDLSRGVFLGPVDLSKAVILREGYFVHSRFTRPAQFAGTAFGVHSRFFRAVFAEPVTYRQAAFSGLAEFLQVTFQKDADFSRATFKLGTGFSGSEFLKRADFSEAVFEREAYFLFSVFGGDASFRQAIFRSVADFSDSQFKGSEDFTEIRFESRPRFERAKLVGDRSTPFRAQGSTPQLVFTAVLLLVAAVLVIYLVRAK
ncbi:pentapeptide repeat-containing protein [Nitrospira calida]